MKARPSWTRCVGLVIALAAPLLQAQPDPAEPWLTQEDEERLLSDFRSKYCGFRSISAEEIRRKCSDKTFAECEGEYRFGSQFQPQFDSKWQKPEDEINGQRSLVEEAVSSLPLPGFVGAVPDLLPGNDLVSSVGLKSFDTPQVVGLSLNGVLENSQAFEVKNNWFILSFGGFFTPKPEINPLVENRLVGDARAELLQQAADTTIGDEAFYEITFAPLSSWVGREMRWHTPTFTRIWQSANGTVNHYDIDAAARMLDTLGVRGYQRVDTPSRQEAMACMVSLNRAFGHAVNKLPSTYELPSFWKLVHNQPQLAYAYKELRRKGAVGADSRSQRVTFSGGLLNNINWLRLPWIGCGPNLEKAGCADKFRGMASNLATRHSLGFSAFYEWGRILDFSYSVPAPVSTSSADPGTDPGGLLDDVLPPELTPPILQPMQPAVPAPEEIDGGPYSHWGASLGFSLWHPDRDKKADDRTSARVDAVYEKWKYNEQPLRVDHSIRRITLTYRWRNFSIPLHFVYRQKTEFDADVDSADRLGVGLGAGWGF